MNSAEPATKRPLPLSVVFEGQSSKLTTLLHTTIAIWLVVLLTDREEYFLLKVDRGEWTQELTFYVACMITATLAGAVAVGVLSLNLRPVHKDNWRIRSCRSIFALVLIDLLAIDILYFAVRILCTRSEDVVSIPATAFVTILGIGFTVWFNVLYIQLFGCCVCCHCGEDASNILLERAQRIDYRRHELVPRHIVSTSTSAADESRCCSTDIHNIEAPGPSAPPMEHVSSDVVNDRDFPPVEAPEPVVQFKEEEIRQEDEKAVVQGTKEDTGEKNEASTKDTPCVLTVPDTAEQERPPALREMRRWDTMKLVEVGSHKLHKQSSSQQRSMDRCPEIVIEESEKAKATRRPSSRKPMIGPDIIGIARRLLRTDETDSSSFKLSEWSISNLWNSVREEPGHFRYAVWIKSAFLTSVIVLVFTHIRTLAVIANHSDLYKENRDRFQSNLDEFNTFLIHAGWLNGIDSITKTVVVQLYLVFDAVALNVKYTCWVGYSLGLLVGLYSLVAVLIQHKRISLAVSDGLHTFRREAASKNQEMESPWPAFQKKYPILGACFFLAILSSTAVLQLHIVGFSVSVLLSLPMNVMQLSVLMDIFGYYLLAYFIVFIIDVIVMRFLESWLISADGAHIRHPRWFNFTIVVLSMVHLVIGLLYALWRLLFAMVTTIVTLNRLDVSLFMVAKRLDPGHRAFMSMLVLTVLIQDDHESFAVRNHDAV